MFIEKMIFSNAKWGSAYALCDSGGTRKWGVAGNWWPGERTRSGFHWAKWLIAENKKLDILLWNIIF